MYPCSRRSMMAVPCSQVKGAKPKPSLFPWWCKLHIHLQACKAANRLAVAQLPCTFLVMASQLVKQHKDGPQL